MRLEDSVERYAPCDCSARMNFFYCGDCFDGFVMWALDEWIVTLAHNLAISGGLTHAWDLGYEVHAIHGGAGWWPGEGKEAPHA